jgi:hypothetical protein
MIGGEPAELEKETEIVRMILLQIAMASNMVELHVHQPEGFTELSEKPKLNRIARWQMRSANNVITTLGLDMKIEDAVSRRLLELLDGKRTRNALFDEIGKFIRFARDRRQKGDPCRIARMAR